MKTRMGTRSADGVFRERFPREKVDEIRVGLDGGILPDNPPGSLSFVCLEEEYEGGMLYGCLEEISAEGGSESRGGNRRNRRGADPGGGWRTGFLNGISVKPACQKLLLLDAGGVPIQPGDWKAGEAVRPGLVFNGTGSRRRSGKKFLEDRRCPAPGSQWSLVPVLLHRRRLCRRQF